MTEINALYQNLTNSELANAILEINETKTTGIVGNMVRKMAHANMNLIPHLKLDLELSETLLLTEAANRWLKTQN